MGNWKGIGKWNDCFFDGSLIEVASITNYFVRLRKKIYHFETPPSFGHMCSPAESLRFFIQTRQRCQRFQILQGLVTVIRSTAEVLQFHAHL